MKLKSISTLLFILIFIITFTIGCNKKENIQDYVDPKEEMELNPIPKEIVISILKSEYGENIDISENDISVEGNNYVVEVYVEILDEEEHDGHTEPHTHRESLGIHKIDMYSGEIIE